MSDEIIVRSDIVSLVRNMKERDACLSENPYPVGTGNRILWGIWGHAPHNAHPEKMTPSHPSSGRTAGARAPRKRKRAALIFATQKCRDREEKTQRFHMLAQHAYEIAVACPHTSKSRDTPEKGKMAVFCRFSGFMTPMILCMTPVMTAEMAVPDSVTGCVTPSRLMS